MNKSAGSGSPVREIRREEGCIVVDVTGDIDINHSGAFQEELTKVIAEKPRHIVVNLGGVEYMDSAGVASLVKLRTQTKEIGASLALAEVGGKVRSVLEITRLDGVFKMFDSESEAIASA